MRDIEMVGYLNKVDKKSGEKNETQKKICIIRSFRVYIKGVYFSN